MLKPSYRVRPFYTSLKALENGQFRTLEYRASRSAWLFGRRLEADFWHPVPKPFLDSLGRARSRDKSDCFVTDKQSFNDFVKLWPAPAAYLAWCRDEQARLQRAFAAVLAAEPWRDDESVCYFW